MCDFITSGRQEPCKDSVGGISAVYFVNYGDMGVINYSTTVGEEEVIDTVTGTPIPVKCDVRNKSSYT